MATDTNLDLQPDPQPDPDRRSLRDRVAFYLDDLETPLGQGISLTIAALIFISSGIFVAETYPLSPSVLQWLERLDSAILYIFAIEYAVRFWAAADKLRFAFSPLSLVDLMAVLPFFFGVGRRGFLLTLRWFRLLRIIRFLDLRILVFRVGTENQFILSRIFLTLFIIIFVFSGLIYQVEHPVNPDIFNTFLDAVYFAIVTMTTVGFGDVIPFSEVGRLLTILMILTGVALIPWQLGELIQQLVKSSDRRTIACSTCHWASHDRRARFCQMCGTKLPEPESD